VSAIHSSADNGRASLMRAHLRDFAGSVFGAAAHCWSKRDGGLPFDVVATERPELEVRNRALRVGDLDEHLVGEWVLCEDHRTVPGHK
jgi:hypothetical protein